MKEITMKYLGRDSHNRHTYISDSGRICKFTNIFLTREEAERRDRLYTTCINGMDGEPDCHVRSDVKIKFV